MRYTLIQAVDEIKAYKRYKNLPYNDDVEVQSAPVTAKAPEQSFQSKEEAPKVAEQAKPVVKAEPVKAAEPAKPVEKKPEPVKAAEPVKPVEKKAEPAKPVEKKADPAKVAVPVKPDEKKAEPEPVFKKAEPVKAAEPAKPVEKKAEPVKAAEPVKSVEKKAEPVKAAEPAKPVEKKEEAPRPARVAFMPIQPYQFQPYQAENTQKVGMRYTLDQAEAETEAYKKYKNLRSENAVSDATYDETPKKAEPAKSEPVKPTAPAKPVDKAPAESAKPAAPVKNEPVATPAKAAEPAKAAPVKPAEKAEKPVEKRVEIADVRVVTFDKPSSGEVVYGDPFEEEVKKYSAFRYGLGAVLAFFGFSNKTHRASKKRAKLVGDIFTYIILLFGAFIMVYPFWWMIAGSFADTASTTISSNILKQMVWWPENTTVSAGENFFRNYDIVFNTAFTNIAVSSRKAGMFAFLISNGQFNFWVALLNNLVYSIVPVIVGVITSASAAFSFAKIQWIGRNAVFYFLLAAIMVPGPSIMISQYVMYNSLGWRNNGLVMIIPGLFGSIMTAFFIRQFLFGLPTSIIEAAKIDGAGYFRIFCGFILPLAMPAIMAQGILSFMGCWNNYMASFIMIDSNSSAINLPHAITIIANNAAYETDIAVTIAASVISVIPVMILFACFQNLIIGSLMLTGSKE